MSTIFLYEDGHENVADEEGGPQPMDYIVDENGFVVETLAIHSEYMQTVSSSESSLTSPMLIEKPKDEDTRMKDANTKRDYVRYAVQDKVRFFELKIEKYMNALSAAKKLGRRCILTEDHKMTVINFIDTNPSASVVEVVEHSLSQFHDLKVSRSTVYNFMRSEYKLSLKKADFHSIEERYNWVGKWDNFLANCVFLDESAFDINMKRSRAWSRKGTHVIVTRPTTRANTTSILGAGHYVVMDNAPIHTHKNIKKYIEYRGYKCVHLPTYSPELNPIEQFWAVAKKLTKPAKMWRKVISEASFHILTSVGMNVEIESPCNIHRTLPKSM
ncbi:hypothetical protein G6F56_001073 [Rhizopus delemar]|nr:hypothetical protein G6F56_001073 [Rhizopus delemar]